MAAPPSSAVAPSQPPSRNVADHDGGDLAACLDALLKVSIPDIGTTPIPDIVAAIQTQLPTFSASLDEFFAAATKGSSLNDAAAEGWKNKGNDDLSRGDGDIAVIHYTKGMMLALSDGLLATLLNNRATVFYQQRRLREALMDSHLALQLKPDYWKALKRRGACLTELGFAELGARDASAAEQEAVEAANAPDDSALCAALVKPYGGPFAPPPVAVLHPEVQLQRDAKGRFVVATTRIDPSTNILLETPYACAPRGEGLFTACAHCMHRTPALYPSPHYRAANVKSRGLFCSMQCAYVQWALYGARESQNPFYLMCSVDTLLALRMMQTPFDECSVTESIATPAEPDVDVSSSGAAERPAGVVGAGQAGDVVVDSSRVQRRKVPFDPVAPGNPLGQSHVNLMIGAFTKELVPFAEVGGKESLIAALALLRNVVTTPAEAERLRKALRQVLVNAFHISCVDRIISNTDSHSFVQVTVGKAIYSIASLFNHSCDPNCFVSFQGNPHACSGRLCIRLIRPVMEGEELCIAYANIDKTHMHSTRGRIRALRAAYGFACTCSECRNAVDEGISKDCEAHYVKAADIYQKGRRLIREGNYEEAVNVLFHSYDIVMQHICPPPRPPQMMLPKTHDALAQAYLLLGNKEKCFEHLQAALSLNIQLHGGEYADLIREYTRLAILGSDKTYSDKALRLLELYYCPSEFLEAEKLYLRSSASQRTPN